MSTLFRLIDCPLKYGLKCAATLQLIKSSHCIACPRLNDPYDAFGHNIDYDFKILERIVVKQLPKEDIAERIVEMRMDNPGCIVYFDSERQELVAEMVN